MNIPNMLTLARIVFIPLMVVLFYLPYAWSLPLTAALFGLAAITDWLDGYLARRWNQSTPFGAFLDPVADKVMVAVALALLIERYEAIWLTLPALVIIGREIVISARFPDRRSRHRSALRRGRPDAVVDDPVSQGGLAGIDSLAVTKNCHKRLTLTKLSL